MKLGLFWDEAININSYYVENSTGYTFDDKPYTYHHSVSSQCYPATHNFTFLWGDGVFLNLSEWDELPDYDFDIIFYANERNGLDSKKVNQLGNLSFVEVYDNNENEDFTIEDRIKTEAQNISRSTLVNLGADAAENPFIADYYNLWHLHHPFFKYAINLILIQNLLHQRITAQDL